MNGEEDVRAAERVRQATEWFVRLKDAPSAADRRAFRSWISGDPARHDAFNAVKRLWADLEVPAAVLGQDGWYRHERRALRLGKQLFYWLGAAAVCGVAAAAVLWLDPGLPDRWRADQSTPLGVHKQVQLPDGTHALLDGGTAIDLRFSSTQRRVEILHGRVWFDVAHTWKKPLSVKAGDAVIKDIGTAFAVDRSGSDAIVTVERGLVSVSLPDGEVTQVAARHTVMVSGEHIGPVSDVDVDAAFAWRRGLIILDHAPLAAVVGDLQHTRLGRLIIPQADVRRWPLTGVFRADDPQAILDALRSTLGLRIVTLPGLATLVYR